MELRHLPDIYKRLQGILANRPHSCQRHPCGHRPACNEKQLASAPPFGKEPHLDHPRSQSNLPHCNQDRRDQFHLRPKQKCEPQNSRPAHNSNQRNAQKTGASTLAPSFISQPGQHRRSKSRKMKMHPGQQNNRLMKPHERNPRSRSHQPYPCHKQISFSDGKTKLRKGLSPCNHKTPQSILRKRSARHEPRTCETRSPIPVADEERNSGQRSSCKQHPVAPTAPWRNPSAYYQIRAKWHHNPRPQQKKHFDNPKMNPRRKANQRQDNPNNSA